MPTLLKTVLLLALPASGKSEVRRYLDHLPESARANDFFLGETIQLDDFVYVHLMRCIDDELVRQKEPRAFFEAPDRSFRDPRDWETLIELLNEDHADLIARRSQPAWPSSAAELFFDRLDRAAGLVG